MDLQEQFNKVSGQYDGQRKMLIPCFDDFYGVLIENLQVTRKDPVILDLGAGTGLLSKFVYDKYPDAQITLVDISDKMLDVARERFQGISTITIKREDLTTITIDPNQYDAIVSSLAIHHLEDEEKQKLYAKIYKGLKENGAFLHAEQVWAESPYFEELYERQWKYKVDHSGLEKEEIEAAYGRVSLDKRTPLSVQLEWLRKIGFTHVDCLYKYYDFTVMYAKK